MEARRSNSRNPEPRIEAPLAENGDLWMSDWTNAVIERAPAGGGALWT